MIYIISLLLSTLYIYTLSLYRNCNYWKTVAYLLPIIFLWVIIIGGQYNVGTDYYNYLDMFSGKDLWYVEENRGEILFSGLIKVCNYLGIYGQGIFMVLSIIAVLTLILVIKSVVPNKDIYLYYFTFICFCGTFHNQMNGVRQYLAIYLVSLMVCSLMDKRYIVTGIVMIAVGLVHQSAWLIIPFILGAFIICNKLNQSSLYLIVFVGVGMSIILTDSIFEQIIPFFKTYAHYMEDGRIGSSAIINRITKYIYIPIILYAIWERPNMALSKRQNQWFCLGVMGYVLKLSVVSLSIVARMGRYLEIFSCIPIVLLLIYWRNNSRIKAYILGLVYLFAPYASKVLIASKGEYSFDSFLLH